jgi:hypothetical protein
MRKGLWLALLVAIAACDATKTVTGPRRPTASSAAAVATPAPVASPTAAAATLQKPQGKFTSLAGTIAVDPAYVVAAGAGNIIATGAGNVVAAGAGNIVGGNASAALGSTGNGIVATGGGNLIATGAGNVTAKRRLMATDAGELPAAGMEISVLDLASDVPLPLGKDANGRDVYTVLSDAAGRYEVYLPDGVATNVLVVARVPGQDDPRLAYDLAAAPGGSVALDEDSALLTRFIRQTYTSAMRTVLTRLLDPKPGAATDLVVAFNGSGLPTAQVEAIFGPVLDGLRTSLQARGITAAQVPDEAERQADALLAKIALDKIGVDARYGVDAKERAYPNLIAALAGARAAVNARIAGQPGPTFFADVPIFKTNNATIRKATDVMEFIVTRDFPDLKRFNGNEPEQILQAVGVDAAEATRLLKLARAGGSGISVAITNTFLDADTLSALAQKVQAPPRPAPTHIPHLKSRTSP